MLLNGILSKHNNEWIVIEDQKQHPTHPQHKLWLLIHGEEGMNVCFILDKDNHAILKACGPDTHEYTQD
jgi:hypothetical protein